MGRGLSFTLGRPFRAGAWLLDGFSVETPHCIRRDFNASHCENFADHSERRAFLPKFSDAVAERQ
jgi:hypothetical protein